MEFDFKKLEYNFGRQNITKNKGDARAALFIQNIPYNIIVKKIRR